MAWISTPEIHRPAIDPGSNYVQKVLIWGIEKGSGRENGSPWPAAPLTWQILGLIEQEAEKDIKCLRVNEIFSNVPMMFEKQSPWMDRANGSFTSWPAYSECYLMMLTRTKGRETTGTILCVCVTFFINVLDKGIPTIKVVKEKKMYKTINPSHVVMKMLTNQSNKLIYYY